SWLKHRTHPVLRAVMEIVQGHTAALLRLQTSTEFALMDLKQALARWHARPHASTFGEVNRALSVYRKVPADGWCVRRQGDRVSRCESLLHRCQRSSTRLRSARGIRAFIAARSVPQARSWANAHFCAECRKLPGSLSPTMLGDFASGQHIRL